MTVHADNILCICYDEYLSHAVQNIIGNLLYNGITALYKFYIIIISSSSNISSLNHSKSTISL